MPRLGSLALGAVIASLAAGCGGTSAAPGKTAQGKDVGREVMTALVSAAAKDDASGAWELLSQPSRRRTGPTLRRFEAATFPGLRRTLAPFVGGELPLEISQKIVDRFGLVVLSRGAHAYAVPLRREGDYWRVELPGGSLRLDNLQPPPGSKAKFSNQIGVESHGRTGAGVALLYLDGLSLDPTVYTGPVSATIFANYESSLKAGRHTAVAFVSARGNATARAWTFEP